MSESKHTPGPWVDEDNEGFGAWKIYSKMSPSGHGPCGKRIAEVIGDSAETDANAHLIATAPELLEALKAMLDMYLRLANSGDAGFWNPEEDKEVIQARAAIAKAEGKA